MSPLQPFVDWAKSVLDAADGGTYIPPDGATLQFQTTLSPVWTGNNGAAFHPGTFEPTENGLVELIASAVENEMDATVIEGSIFAKSMVEVIYELQSYEHWVVAPLTPSEMIGMHIVLHNVLTSIAQRNGMVADVERWTNSGDKVIIDKLLLAVAYVLAWQPYGHAMQFVWGLAKPWYVRLSEVVSLHLDNDDLAHLYKSLLCLKDRVHHFDNLLYGYLEGGASLEKHEDMDADDDVDAVEMYHGRRVVRTEDGDVDDQADY